MNSNVVVVERSITTQDLMKMMFSELHLLVSKKITPARASASARLGMTILGAAQHEVTRHKLKSPRTSAVRPVSLVKGDIVQTPAIEDKSKKRRK